MDESLLGMRIGRFNELGADPSKGGFGMIGLADRRDWAGDDLA